MTDQIAELLRQKIRDSGETLVKLSMSTDLSEGTLSHFIRGSRGGITLTTSQKLADHFDLVLCERKWTEDQ